MAKKNPPARGPKPKGKGTNVWYRRFLEQLCFEGGFIVEEGTPIGVLKAIIGKVQNAHGDYEHSVPDQMSERLAYFMRCQGADPNEIAQAIEELVPAAVVATIEGASVETVRENRKQVREARKTHGVFSAEARSARKDLRRDRRASRRARRRSGSGVDTGDLVKLAAAMV